ncbi:integrase [Buttiauxella sp. B2]|uniref:tyrosine-type recombinase/integrase n=1 Tax=Buttiauxella sp. B2 TaxID=2587812 RepID=UPI00111DACDC|nr:tyrosine-type recombinase/integrase [Buttiauxella sp. B2]TNV22863.1 integrase [Buttiauxella sp. B2]
MSRRKNYDANLPRNLTYRAKYKAYYWRNPLTKKEIPLGQISRRDAVTQAIEANNFIEQQFTPVALMERLTGEHEFTLTEWLERYEAILLRRELAVNTYKVRSGQIKTIGEKLGDMVLSKVTTLHVAEFLEPWIIEGKKTMAGAMRSVLSDIFREAIVGGRITINPVEPTRAPKITVSRQRLSLEQFQAIRHAAEHQPAWFGLAMDLALVAGQRREDVTKMKFSDIYDDRLHVTQVKTGAMIAIPLSLTLNSAGLKLGALIDCCRLASRSEFLVSAGIRKNSPDGSVHPDSLTKGFVKARINAGIELSGTPPTFHEIRSLSGRLYEKVFGKEFTQKLLGHKSEKMTEKYLDSREKAFTLL